MTIQTWARAEVTLGSDVANGGTVSFPYPSGVSQGDQAGGDNDQRVWLEGLNVFYDSGNADVAAADFSFDATEVVWTYGGSTTIPAGTRVVLEIKLAEAADLDTGTATTEQIATKVNGILATLRDRGIL
jgi:hypothetical protein